MDLTVTPEGEWRRPEDESDVIYRYIAQRAPSGRARCRRCSECIKKSSVRLGHAVRWSGGTYGFISSWQHVECTRAEGELNCEEEIFGFSNLDEEEKEQILAEIFKTEPPSHIETIDPNDPAFLQTRTLTRVPAPETVTLPLLPYQEEGFGWMQEQEAGEVKGGILADEMGMGKTIQAISLIAGSKTSKGRAKKAVGIGPTLVVCPASAMLQWNDEIRRATREGSLSVLVYYQNRSAITMEDIMGHDVVLTTYQVLEYEYRTASDKMKMACAYCGKRYLPRSLKWHNKYFCGPEAERTEKQSKQDRKKDSTAKAMKTLKIVEDLKELEVDADESDLVGHVAKKRRLGPSRHTPMAIYRDLMAEANRDTLEMYEKSTQSGGRRGGGGGGGGGGGVDSTSPPTSQSPRSNTSTKSPPGESPKADRWVCPMCTFHNSMADTQCVACSGARQTRSRAIARVREETATSPPPPPPPPPTVVSLPSPEPPQPRATRSRRTQPKEEPVSDEDETDMVAEEKPAPPVRRSKTKPPPSPSPLPTTKRRKPAKKPAQTAPRKRRRLTDSGSESESEFVPSGDESSVQSVSVQDVELQSEGSELEADIAPPTPSPKRSRKASAQRTPAQRAPARSSRGRAGKADPLVSDPEPDPSAPKKPKKEERSHAGKGEFVDSEGIDLSTSLLHCVEWGRVVLDEAHKIKSRTNSTAKSAFAVRSERRWCLTGTPLQNRVGELFALIRFLQLEPYAFYMCSTKGCECRSLHYRFGVDDKYCIDCGHTKLKHFSYFNKFVMNPIKRYGYVGDGRRAMLLLKDQVLGRIMLRRTKQERAADVQLPPLNIRVEELDLDATEKDFYECIYKQTRSRFDKFVDKGVLLHNYAHVFELLSRLRQAVDHPYLVVHGSYKGRPSSLPSSSAVAGGAADVCCICNLDILSARDCAVSACRHTFHRECITDYIGGEEAEGAAEAKKPKRKRSAAPLGEGKLCPECYLPLSITMDLRGVDEDSEEEEMDATPKRKPKPAKKPAKKVVSTPSSPAASGVDPAVDESGTSCVICMESPRTALLLPCGHVYTCMQCVSQLPKRICPICRSSIQRVVEATASNTQDQAVDESPAKKLSLVVGRRSIMQQIDVKSFASSTKVEAVVNAIKAVNPDEKAIIFSQYIQMIDIVEWRLRSEQIKSVKLMGYMPMSQRRSVLAAFKTDPSVRVILMSLKAGGEGLNLQEATHVFVLEPWWNPQVELQAIQRAHRIGQTRPVYATRFITRGTIEDRMLELQKKKQLVFEGAVDSSAQALSQLTEEDLRFLFGQG